MWQLDYPWLLLLMPLPWLAYRYLPHYREARSAVRVPFFRGMTQAIDAVPSNGGAQHNRAQLLLNLLVWAFLVVAIARPVWVEKPIERQQPVRDLMLAIDISQSMETQDFNDANGHRIDRLAAVKQVVHGFIQQRKDDRIGLILFGSGAYPQAPLTLDHASLALLLDDSGIGMAGPNTAIGDAIGLGLKLLDQAHELQKVLILLTDGNDTSSAIPPDHAADIAAAKGVIIHTIAIGDPQASGEAKVDLSALQAIASATGGRYFLAEDRDSLAQVYATLDKITPHQVKTLSHQPKRDLFWWPLSAALALLALYHLVAAGWSHRRTADESQ
jgi:Ca-activated chloride channel family protein